jgi:hypothetical protein
MSAKIGNRRLGGKQLLGAATSAADGNYKFIGVTTLSDLMMFGLIRPSRNDKARPRDFKNEDDGRSLKAAHEVREQVQRRFDKNRMERAKRYADYIEEISNGERFGSTPPVTLYCPAAGEIDAEGFVLTLPATSPLVNLDGETQTEARFILRDRDPASAENLPIDFVLYHGISQEHAGAIMHDFNKYAHPVREQAIAPLHPTGPLSSVVFEALREVNLDPESVQRFKARPNKKETVSFECLLAGATGSSLGLAAPALNAAISRLNNGENGVDRGKAIAFLRHAIPLATENRASIALAAPAVWALMGAIARDFGKLVSAEEWTQAAAAYNQKPQENGVLVKGPRALKLKRGAALAALNLRGEQE